MTVDPRRPAERYVRQDCSSIGTEFSDQVWMSASIIFSNFSKALLQAILEMIRVIFSLKNLRRDVGQAGILASITVSEYGTDSVMYVDATGNVTAWPGSLQLVVSFHPSRPSI